MNDNGFKDFNKEFLGRGLDSKSGYPLLGILYLAMGVDRIDWPNIYHQFKDDERFHKLGRKFYGTREGEEVREIRANMIDKLNSAINDIDEIKRQSKLKGRCKYVSLTSLLL